LKEVFERRLLVLFVMLLVLASFVKSNDPVSPVIQNENVGGDDAQQKFDNYIQDLSSKGFQVNGLTKDIVATDFDYGPPQSDVVNMMLLINKLNPKLTVMPNAAEVPVKISRNGKFEVKDGKVSGTNVEINGKKYASLDGVELGPNGEIISGTFVEASAPASPVSPGSSGESGSGGSSPMQVTEPRDASFSESSYTVGSASSFRQGDMFLTNAQGLVGTVDSTCGSVADSMIVKSIMQSGVSDFCVKGDSVEVGHAEQVQIKCDGDGRTFTTSSIDDSVFTVNDKIRVKSNSEQEIGITDCAGNDLEVTFMNEESKADFANDGLTIMISNTTVYWPEEDPSDLEKPDIIIQDILQANGSATLHLDRLTKKVQWVEMEPYFKYEFRTGNPVTDFAIQASDVPAKLFIRRTVNQAVPEEFTACKNCGVIDLPQKMISIRGDIDYLRKWFDTKKTGLLNDYSVIYHTTNPDAVVVMNFDSSHTFVDDFVVMEDAPPLTAIASNYLAIKELKVGNETHRLLGIDEKLPKEQLAQNIIKSYRTIYSPAIMKIDNNNLNYKRGTFVVDVLSVDNPRSNVLINGLLSLQSSLVLLGLLIPVGFFRKKAQITVFIILGLVLLIAFVMFLGFSGTFTSLPMADIQGVNAFTKACLDQSGKESLQFIGAQGGTTQKPLAFWFDKTAKPLTKDDVEASLRTDLSARVKKCVDKLPDRFKGIVKMEQAIVSVGVKINQTTSFSACIIRRISSSQTTSSHWRTSRINSRTSCCKRSI
jgi:hypothetical protein